MQTAAIINSAKVHMAIMIIVFKFNELTLVSASVTRYLFLGVVL